MFFFAFVFLKKKMFLIKKKKENVFKNILSLVEIRIVLYNFMLASHCN